MDTTVEVDNLNTIPIELLQKALDALQKESAAEEKRRSTRMILMWRLYKLKREETKRLKEQQLKVFLFLYTFQAFKFKFILMYSYI